MIRVSLLALLGLASFAVVYVATEPRQPPAAPAAPTDTAVAMAPESPTADSSLEEPSTTGSAHALPSAVTEAPETESHNDRAVSEVDSEIAFELRPTTESPDDETSTDDVRNVTPPNMTSGPRVTGPLARVQPAPDAPADEAQGHMERLFNPIVVSAGTIKAGGRDIHLDGIAAPAFDERCGEGEAAWPCGRMARAALRRFIRGRAIECEVPEGAGAIPDPATCRVAGEDISRWLVAQGWAKRSANSYGEEEGSARDAGLGLWGDGRPRADGDVASSG